MLLNAYGEGRIEIIPNGPFGASWAPSLHLRSPHEVLAMTLFASLSGIAIYIGFIYLLGKVLAFNDSVDAKPSVAKLSTDDRPALLLAPPPPYLKASPRKFRIAASLRITGSRRRFGIIWRHAGVTADYPADIHWPELRS